MYTNTVRRNTPFDVSRFPGAGSLRICTAGHFTLKTPHPINFTLLNTHLDDQSDAQRRLGASLILTRAKYEAFTSNGPVLVTGDFNSPNTGADSGAYNISTGVLPIEPVNATFAQKFAVPTGALPGFVLQDLRAMTPRFMVSGDFATYTGFNAPGDSSVYSHIDFVFGASTGKWYVLSYLRVPFRALLNLGLGPPINSEWIRLLQTTGPLQATIDPCLWT